MTRNEFASFQSFSKTATLCLVVFCAKTALYEGNDLEMKTTAIPGLQLTRIYQLEITEHFCVLTWGAFVVKHSIWPNADIYFASDKAVFIIGPCRQLTCIFTHSSVLVVVLRCNSNPESKAACMALWNEKKEKGYQNVFFAHRLVDHKTGSSPGLFGKLSLDRKHGPEKSWALLELIALRLPRLIIKYFFFFVLRRNKPYELNCENGTRSIKCTKCSALYSRYHGQFSLTFYFHRRHGSSVVSPDQKAGQ